MDDGDLTQDELLTKIGRMLTEGAVSMFNSMPITVFRSLLLPRSCCNTSGAHIVALRVGLLMTKSIAG
jgi:hypothetical protein